MGHAPRPYGRTLGAALAFSLVGLFVKYADLLLTYELEPETLGPAARVWLSLRFSWQEFTILTALLAIILVWQRCVQEPGRKTRVALGLFRAGLVAGVAVSVAGIKYYGMYQGHMMVTDFLENIPWAVQIVKSINVFDSPATQLGGMLGALFLVGVPWLCARLEPRAAVRLGAIALAIGATMAVGTWAAGRPRLTEAQLEPHPLLWFFRGPYATYFDPPPIETPAPIGPQQQRYAVTEPPRNLILVVLESVPAHALAGYKASATTGRRLVETYGDEITTFEQIFADVPISDSTILSMLTGLAPIPTNQEALKATRGRPTLLTDLYAHLKETGLAESTAVLAFGDHGQAFGEHRGNFVHSKELYWENLHVPMLLLHPTRLGLPPRIPQLGALVDVMPTVLDMLGIEPPPGDGMSLLNEAPDRLLFQMTPFGPGVAGFRNTQYFYSLSRTGRELLFDRVADPLEQHDIRDERPDVAASFRARLRR